MTQTPAPLARGRRIRISFVAFDAFWASLLAKGLNDRFGDELACSAVLQGSGVASMPRYFASLEHSDVVVRVGGTVDLGSRLNRRFFGAAARRQDARFIVYWIGTDAYLLTQAAKTEALTPSAIETLSLAEHITGADHLTAELHAAGLLASTVPVPLAVLAPPAEVPPMPHEFRVLTYVSEGSGPRFEFYGGPQVLEAARALPRVPFTVMGADQIAADVPSNVEVIGKTDDPASQYARASVVVRILEHDGGGGTANEARMFGRRLIYSYPAPHALHVRFGDVRGLVDAIDSLAREHANGTLALDTAAIEWAGVALDPDARFSRLRDVLVSGRAST